MSALRERLRRILKRGGLPSRAVGPGPVLTLSVSPPVFLSGIPFEEYLGIAGAFARRYGDIPAGFIIFPTRTIERAGTANGPIPPRSAMQ